MRLVKYSHACVRLETGDAVLVIDPGVFSEAEALDGADAVLITHEHFDHLDVDKLVAARQQRPELRIYTHDAVAAKLEPLTVCLYEVDCEDIVDLTTDEGRSAAGVSLDDMACAWALDAAERRKPASWKVAQDLIASGAAGIVAPSFARGTRPDMRNLVLWKWGRNLPWRVAVHDPSGRLPKDMLSCQ